MSLFEVFDFFDFPEVSTRRPRRVWAPRERQLEAFRDLAAMLAREHELLKAWRAQGWVDDMGIPPRPQS